MGAATRTHPPTQGSSTTPSSTKLRRLGVPGQALSNLAIAPSTLKSYTSSWTKFLTYLNKPDSHVPSWKNFYDYIIFLSDQGATSNSLSMFRSACSHFAPMYGASDPNSCNVLSRMLKGASKLHIPQCRKLSPFTESNVLDFINITRHSKNLRDWQTTTSVILAFLGFLRISEVHSLRMNDVVLEPDNIRLSKWR